MDKSVDWSARASKAVERARTKVLSQCSKRITKAIGVLDTALDDIEAKPSFADRLKAAQLVVEWAEAAPPKELNVRHSGSVISKELEDAARIALDVMVKELEG